MLHTNDSAAPSTPRFSALASASRNTFHNAQMSSPLPEHAPVLTQFGDMVDVRKRGALRIMRIAGAQERNLDTPAVVRLWHEEQCRELSARQARALANQLLAAADLVDNQNYPA